MSCQLYLAANGEVVSDKYPELELYFDFEMLLAMYAIGGPDTVAEWRDGLLGRQGKGMKLHFVNSGCHRTVLNIQAG